MKKQIIVLELTYDEHQHWVVPSTWNFAELFDLDGHESCKVIASSANQAEGE